MGDCFTAATATSIGSRDSNRLIGKVSTALARTSPFINLLKGGSLPNVSSTVRVAVQERAVVAASLVAPAFVNDASACGTFGSQDQVGTTEYSITLGTFRGRGPRVCVKDGRTAFMGSYIAAQDAMQKAIIQINNADIKSNLLLRSGVKFTMRQTGSFDSMISGDVQSIDTKFVGPSTVPNSILTFKALQRLVQFAREELLVEPFEGNDFKLIGSYELIESLRADANVVQDLRALTTGKYKLGEQSITGYQWEGPYRGVSFGIDQQPFRTNGFNGSGDLVLIEPETSTAATTGVASRKNSAWAQAKYEVAFLVGRDSFMRLLPEKYVGEGTFKFAPQLFAGELQWHYQIDNDCNQFGDYGWHKYQIQRAFQPYRPHAVIPILYQRCFDTLGGYACSSSYTGA